LLSELNNFEFYMLVLGGNNDGEWNAVEKGIMITCSTWSFDPFFILWHVNLIVRRVTAKLH
jgi:hypothetical protein